jgi:hypothetical protein
VVERFTRRYGGRLAVSDVALPEARNVFSRVTGEREPREWDLRKADVGARLDVEPMQWDLLRGACETRAGGVFSLLRRHGQGLAAAAEELQVFQPLDAAGRQHVARLRR